MDHRWIEEDANAWNAIRQRQKQQKHIAQVNSSEHWKTQQHGESPLTSQFSQPQTHSNGRFQPHQRPQQSSAKYMDHQVPGFIHFEQNQYQQLQQLQSQHFLKQRQQKQISHQVIYTRGHGAGAFNARPVALPVVAGAAATAKHIKTTATAAVNSSEYWKTQQHGESPLTSQFSQPQTHSNGRLQPHSYQQQQQQKRQQELQNSNSNSFSNHLYQQQPKHPQNHFEGNEEHTNNANTSHNEQQLKNQNNSSMDNDSGSGYSSESYCEIICKDDNSVLSDISDDPMNKFVNYNSAYKYTESYGVCYPQSSQHTFPDTGVRCRIMDKSIPMEAISKGKSMYVVCPVCSLPMLVISSAHHVLCESCSTIFELHA